MTRQIAGFELRLPESWHAVPGGLPDVSEWARATADELVRGAMADGEVAAQIEDTVDVLAEQLVDVAASVQESGITALETAALVRNPERGVVDAMIAVVAQQGLTAVAFTHQLKELVEDAEATEYLYAGEIEGTVDAGEVAGMHMMLGDPAVDRGDGVAQLEERVVLGVFPEGGSDMIEVTAIARSVGSFDDMPQEMIDLLAGLSVEMENA
ncbi:hypothetical protein [Promicromonospora sp. NPDC023987]|uniref:hypothetical protein n=1 Tax=Promicromonospora sp. NPDC023987 TaxID=3155360 RepID=UPI0034057CCC